MKLVSCYVSSFGKLKDYAYNFNDNLSVIIEDNGWGKSTFAAFIKDMFYGINSKSRSLEDNDRLKYKPWNSTEKFGGYVIFSWKDKEYKIERYFGNKESEDTVTITDNKTGKLFPNPEDLGNRIFGINEEGFLSTTYFSQKDFEVKSNSSITAKFNAICEEQDSKLFDKAVAKLSDKLKSYQYSGGRGIIPELNKKIFALDENIERINGYNEVVTQINREITSLETECLSLKQETEVLAQKVADAGKVEALKIKKDAYENAVNKRSSLSKELAKSNEILNGKSVSEEDVNNCLNCYKSYIELGQKKNLLIQNEDAKKPTHSKFNPLNLLPLLFSVIGAVFAFAFNVVLGVILVCLGVIGTVLLCVFNKNGKGVKVEDKSEVQKFSELETEYKAGIDKFLSQFNLPLLDTLSSINSVRDAIKDRDRILSELNDTEKSVKELERYISVDNLSNESSQSLEALRDKLVKTQSLYQTKTVDLANKRASLNRYIDQLSELPDMKSERAELLEKRDACVENQRVLSLTLEYLNNADQNLKVKYRKPLEESVNKYINYVSDSDIKVNIDIDLHATVEEKVGAKDTGYYSKGWQNLFAICKRFALIDILFTTEKPFIILDDPFSDFDDKKLCASLELIKKLSCDYQIIYFVCHNSRKV